MEKSRSFDDKSYKTLTIVLAVMVAACIVLSGILFVLSRAGSLHPAVNEAVMEEIEREETGGDYAEITNNFEGVVIQQ